MAGRFLFQKFASQMSRSTSLLGAHASAPVTRRASESGIRIIHNLFSGASAYPRTPFLNIEGIHGSTARYLSAFSCIRATSKRSSPPKFLPPVITSSKKAAVVDYVRVNRHFSTSPSTKDTDSLEQYLSALGPEWQAKLEAARAERAAQDAEWKARDADFNRYVTMMVGSWTVITLVFVSALGSEFSRSCEGQNGSHCHPSASSADTVVQHPDVQ